MKLNDRKHARSKTLRANIRRPAGIRLGVNIDHAATLRQARGGTTSYPDLLKLMGIVQQAGAHQITIHLREDRRHIQDHDVVAICRKRCLDINLEMAATSEMKKIAIKNKPNWVCLVPEKRFELTTEGGLDVAGRVDYFKKYVLDLQKKTIFVSLFIDPNLAQVRAAAEIGAKAVEFHTGHWVTAKGAKKKVIWNQLKQAAQLASELGLIVNAGHGLDYEHTKWIRQLPFLHEVNIGHSIICYALEDGIGRVTKKFLNILNASKKGPRR